jgi:hypothetical protein
MKMSNTQLAPRTDDRPASSGQEELLLQAIAHIVSLAKHITAQDLRIASLEARSPPPPFEIPANWIVAKRASTLCGYSLPSIYRFFHDGLIVGIKHGLNTFVDPSSLPAKGSRRHIRRAKKREPKLFPHDDVVMAAAQAFARNEIDRAELMRRITPSPSRAMRK